jgi:hypothetical protein
MRSITIFTILLALAPIARAELNVPNVNDNPATVEDIQKKADTLLDKVVTGVKSQDKQALSSAWDEGISFYMAEKDAIYQNIPTLLSTVGKKVHDVAATASWPEWNFMVSSFYTWAASSDKSSAVMEATPMVMAASAAGGYAPPAKAQPSAWVGTPWEGSEGTGAKEAGQAVTADTTTKAGSAAAATGEEGSAATAQPGRGVASEATDEGTGKVSGPKLASNAAGKNGAAGGAFLMELTDLQVAKCFRMPGKRPVGCRPGVANLCFNSNGVKLPCP